VTKGEGGDGLAHRGGARVKNLNRTAVDLFRGDNGERGREPVWRIGAEPASTIQTGQQWNESGHDARRGPRARLATGSRML